MNKPLLILVLSVVFTTVLYSTIRNLPSGTMIGAALFPTKYQIFTAFLHHPFSEKFDNSGLRAPDGRITKLDPKTNTVTFQDVCAEQDCYFFFNVTKDEVEKAQIVAQSAYFFNLEGTEDIWLHSEHIYGPTLSLLGDRSGWNNLQHMWYSRQFPALVLGMERHLIGDNYTSFENILVDGYTYNHGPVKWHRGLNQMIIDVISERNIHYGGKPLRVYESQDYHHVCCQLLMSQGSGNEMRVASRIGTASAREYIDKVRAHSFKKAGIHIPTKNRCPRKVLVYAKWDSGHKRWLDAREFADLFKAAHPDLEVEYWPVMHDMEFEEQVRYFANLDIFICSDGSHQMAALFMPVQGTVVQTNDGTDWYNPWNEVFGFNEIANRRFLAIETRLATEQEYENYMKDFDQEDLKHKKHFIGAHMVNQQDMLAKVGALIKTIRSDCTRVPHGKY